MIRTACASCDQPGLVTFLDLGESPVANEPPLSADTVDQTWPLQVAVCPACSLVQTVHVVPDKVLFGGGYHFYSSASAPVLEHQERHAGWLLATFGRLARQLTVEIASNDGSLLRHLAAAGGPTLGVDPAAGPSAVAAARGLDVLVEPFGLEVAMRIRDEHGPVGLVVASNVLAHVADLADMLDGIHHLLDTLGVAVVEVQYLPDLLIGNAFDLVYHEHRYFWSLTSLDAACRRHGLAVMSAQLTEPQGGTLQAVIGKPSGLNWPEHNVGHLRQAERWLTDPAGYRSVQGRADRIRQRLRDLVHEQKRAGRTVAAYAATAKAVTLLNWCDLGPDVIGYITDTTPDKIGRLLPGVHIPIVGRDSILTGPDVWLLTAWNYLGHILRQEAAYTAAGGRWILPIPMPVLL